MSYKGLLALDCGKREKVQTLYLATLAPVRFPRSHCGKTSFLHASFYVAALLLGKLASNEVGAALSKADPEIATTCAALRRFTDQLLSTLR